MKTLINSFVVALVALFTVSISANAQNKTKTYKLEGVWLMEYMLYDGKKEPFVCGKTYSQIKVYGKNGEYCCAEIVKDDAGVIKILPHEYGKYSYENDEYIECGRKCGKINWVDENTSKGRWKNRNDQWKRDVKLPSKLSSYIMAKCKAACEGESKEMQKLLKDNILNK